MWFRSSTSRESKRLLAGALRLNLRPLSQAVCRLPVETKYRAYPLTCPAAMQIYGTKESVFIRKELNSHRIGLLQQHGRRLIVLEHQHGSYDVMRMLSIWSVVESSSLLPVGVNLEAKYSTVGSLSQERHNIRPESRNFIRIFWTCLFLRTSPRYQWRFSPRQHSLLHWNF